MLSLRTIQHILLWRSVRNYCLVLDPDARSAPGPPRYGRLFVRHGRREDQVGQATAPRQENILPTGEAQDIKHFVVRF